MGSFWKASCLRKSTVVPHLMDGRPSPLRAANYQAALEKLLMRLQASLTRFYSGHALAEL